MSHEQCSPVGGRSQAEIAESISGKALKLWEYLDTVGAASNNDLRVQFGQVPRSLLKELQSVDLVRKFRSKSGIHYALCDLGGGAA